MSQRLFQRCKEGEREVEDEEGKCGRMKRGCRGRYDFHVSPHTPVLKTQNLCHLFSKA